MQLKETKYNNEVNQIDFDYYSGYDIPITHYPEYDYKYYLYNQGEVLLNAVNDEIFYAFLMKLYKEKHPNIPDNQIFNETLHNFCYANNYAFQFVEIDPNKEQERILELTKKSKENIDIRNEVFKKDLMEYWKIVDSELFSNVYDKVKEKLTSPSTYPVVYINAREIYKDIKALVEYGVFKRNINV